MTDEQSKRIKEVAAGLPRRQEPKAKSSGDEHHVRGDSRGMIRQTLYLPPGVWQAIRNVAHTRKISQQALLRTMISHWLEKEAGVGTWEELERKGSE
jgi:hypothetical protein